MAPEHGECFIHCTYVYILMNLVSDSPYSLYPSPCIINSGPSVWSLSVVPQCGPSVWSLSVVPQCGAWKHVKNTMVHVVYHHTSLIGWALYMCRDNGVQVRCHSNTTISCCLNHHPPVHRSLSQGQLKCDTMSEQLCVLCEKHCTEQNLQRCIN